MNNASVEVINLTNADDSTLQKISQERLLALDIVEMYAIQNYYRRIGRNPTDVELETIAQTWSEHCIHKSLTGIITYEEVYKNRSHLKWLRLGKRCYDNLLKETVFKCTKELNKRWCISVFKDNAGIIEFDKNNCIAFKVETHNHPSAIEPYGGSGTGIGGVIRDILGVGLGGKPILNTDVFCFAPPEYSYQELPEGVLHPKRIMKGVVAGVRDYGNRMGIPTASGCVYFDDEYLCNPLVYCGTVGIIPRDKCFKEVQPGDLIVAIGGRTGRDGIHGATFSSLSLDKDTPLSPVQIGNPIVEKKITDTILQARDKNLYRGLTDCGAGGFSCAIGELAKECGAKVYLERVPLKYAGLLPWEIWLSEAQERMVLAVPKNKIQALLKNFERENVEATILGEFTDSGKLEVFYKDTKVCDISMEFLYKGLPRKRLKAIWSYKQHEEPPRKRLIKLEPCETLHQLLNSLNICSKEWVIRQYDHEVQGQTILKPLQGKYYGPGDACVLWPITLSSGDLSLRYKGIAVSCGINPQYGKIDPYWMAAGAIDEAIRNIISVGGDLNRTALLDNFCWGNPWKVDRMAGLVRAAQACYDIAKVYSTPFISGKDSLNNEYTVMDTKTKEGKSVAIPGTLLISAISVVKDIRKVISMDLKRPGNMIYILGNTYDELGGSELYRLLGFIGNNVPRVRVYEAKRLMLALQKAIERGLVKACHDCSEGGLGVAIAEMAFSGGYGVEIYLKKLPSNIDKTLTKVANLKLLFSETHSRFLVEVAQEKQQEFERVVKGSPFAQIGRVIKEQYLFIYGIENKIILKANITELRNSWQKRLSSL